MANALLFNPFWYSFIFLFLSILIRQQDIGFLESATGGSLFNVLMYVSAFCLPTRLWREREKENFGQPNQLSGAFHNRILVRSETPTFHPAGRHGKNTGRSQKTTQLVEPARCSLSIVGHTQDHCMTTTIHIFIAA